MSNEGKQNLIDIYREEVEQIKKEICDHYCKHNELEDDDLLFEICSTCPLTRLD